MHRSQELIGSPTTLDFGSTIYCEKIYNVAKIHHYKNFDDYFTANTKTNSITLTSPLTTNQMHFSENIQRTFLLDDISVQDSIFENILTSVINRTIENENSLIVSVNRGNKKSSRLWNKTFLETLISWLYQYLAISEKQTNLKYSVRISAIEIDEENNILKNIGERNTETERDDPKNLSLIDNVYSHRFRCNDVNAAMSIFNDYYNNSQKKCDKIKKHILHTIDIYHQSSLKIASSKVSSKCSKIFFMTLDLTKYRNQQNSMSLPQISKFITSHLNKDYKGIKIESNFQRVFSDVFHQNIACHFFITQISARNKNFSESYQLLQMASRIQRLKIKLKKNYNVSPKNNYLGVMESNFHDTRKFSDSEIASTSEISCVETVICLKKERRNSDDESLISIRLRSAFMSSDSDSGFKDLKMNLSNGYSQDETPVNFIKRKTNPRTNSSAWYKSAIRQARTTILTGQEMWVDGPNVFQNFKENSDKGNCSNITPGTVKQNTGTNFQTVKTIPKSKETHYEYENLFNVESSDFRRLSDGREIKQEIEMLKYSKDLTGIIENYCTTINSKTPHTKYNLKDVNITTKSPENDVSRWISDVNQLTSSNCPVGNLYKQFQNNNNFESFVNLSDNNHNFQSHNNVDNYNAYSTIDKMQIFPTNKNQMQINSIDEDEPKMKLISDKKLFNRYKRKDPIDTKDISKIRYFTSKNPFEILKKTLFQNKFSKKKIETEHSSDEKNHNLSPCQEIRYLVPSTNIEDNSDSSSDIECNEWFRSIKTFKNKLDSSETTLSDLRPPSAPLLADSISSQHPFRQRSSSSGYGSVITKDSEISSHIDSNSDQSIHSFPKPMISQSISFTNNKFQGSGANEMDPDVIAERCENLVKQEKMILLIKHQEQMIEDFYNNTRPLLTKDNSKYNIRMSTINYDRLLFDSQYLEELEEDTNIIRDTIAFYKSLVHLESSFLSSPELHKKQPTSTKAAPIETKTPMSEPPIIQETMETQKAQEKIDRLPIEEKINKITKNISSIIVDLTGESPQKITTPTQQATCIQTMVPRSAISTTAAPTIMISKKFPLRQMYRRPKLPVDIDAETDENM